jgi:hypothetical protein
MKESARKTVDRTVDARAKALTAQLSRLLRGLAIVEARRIGRRLQAVGIKRTLDEVRKGRDEDEAARIAEQIAEVLRSYGLQQMQDAGVSAAASAGVVWIAPPQTLIDFVASKDVRIQAILEETRAEVRASVRDLLSHALAQDATPSAGTLARRIKNTFHGQEGAGGLLRGIEQDEIKGILPTARYSTADGTLYAFSPERAALISRTELSQAENTGIFEGYRAANVGEIEWLSLSRDAGAAGGRRHDMMNGKRTTLGVPFVTPLGNRMQYPGDPEAPIGETANCRCTHVAVLGPRRRRP